MSEVTVITGSCGVCTTSTEYVSMIRVGWKQRLEPSTLRGYKYAYKVKCGDYTFYLATDRTDDVHMALISRRWRESSSHFRRAMTGKKNISITATYKDQPIDIPLGHPYFDKFESRFTPVMIEMRKVERARRAIEYDVIEA